MKSKREPLSATSMNPTHLNIRQGERTSLVCPDCKRWRFVKKGFVVGHRRAEPERAANPHCRDRDRRYRNEAGAAPVDYGPRCRGSRRKLVVNLPQAEWELHFAEVLANTAQRRSDSAERLPRPKAIPAVSQMPTPRTAEAARTDHLRNCPRCRTRALCPAGRYLTICVDLLEIAKAQRNHVISCKNCRAHQPCGAGDWMRDKYRSTKDERARQIARLEQLRSRVDTGDERPGPGHCEAVLVDSGS